MQISVLVEPVGCNGYRATGTQPFAAVVEAPTREEALAKLKEEYQDRVRNGAEIVSLSLELAPPENSWMEFAGMFKDDPLIEDWKRSMAEYRRMIDEDPDAL